MLAIDLFETQFNDILIPKLNPETEEDCVNPSHDSIYLAFDPSRATIRMRTTPNYSKKLQFAYCTFYVCRTMRLRDCRGQRCKDYSNQLISVMPQCATWPGLQRWVLQAAACLCSRKDHPLAAAVVSAWDLLMSVVAGDSSSGTDVMSYDGKPEAFVVWARQVNVHDVSQLISWLNGMATGRYKHISLRLPSDLLVDIDDDGAINEAISRIHELHLCPRRIWAVALNLPGRESNIPTLIPDYQSCSDKTEFCNTGLPHQYCTLDYCETSTVDYANIPQLHRPSCGESCEKKEFPTHLLDQVANENRATAWAIDDDLRPVEPGESYMAISHLWSDGTGGSGSVNTCLYNFFRDVARELGCKGLWWDSICMPRSKQARAKATNRMHDYYSQAACTVVHDLCLATSEWVDGNHGSFSLVMSNWFSRGWTALELARSKQVQVIFGTRESPGYVLKNVDNDILCRPGTVFSLSHLVASTAVRSLRRITEQYKPEYSVNDILTSLGPRFISSAKDRAIITGLFVGIENLADDQHRVYRQVICKIGRISPDQVFHNNAPSTGPFAWFPSNLFDLPVSSNEPNIRVQEDGSIVGPWDIILELPSTLGPQMFWDIMHPMAKHRVRQALSDDRHIILVEPHQSPVTRGLLVKVMRKPNLHQADKSFALLCRYVGPVYFRAPQLALSVLRCDYDIFIGDGGLVDLEKGVSAVSYITRSANGPFSLWWLWQH